MKWTKVTDAMPDPSVDDEVLCSDGIQMFVCWTPMDENDRWLLSIPQDIDIYANVVTHWAYIGTDGPV